MDKSLIWHARIPARLRSGGVLATGVALAVLATGGAAVASDAVAGHALTARPIRACYQPGTPTAPLQVVTRPHTPCPTGEKRLVWNTVGPQGPPGAQGPPGLSTGVTTGKVASPAIPIDAGPSAPVVVLTAPAVPSTGIYYITSSATIQVAGGDVVACAAIPGQIEAQTAQFGAPSETISTALDVNGALLMSAGQSPSIECIDANSNSNTEFFEGSLNATLISSSNAAAPARPSRFPLKIVTGAK
jgi:hypothetical protein